MPFTRFVRGLIGIVCLAAGSMFACSQHHVPTERDGPTTEELVAFYSPRSIKILPFTKPASFDREDAIPDGIEVSLRALDGAGDPVKAYGSFVFELFPFENATSDHKGPRVWCWTPAIRSLSDQKAFWESVTNTYQFRLSWDGTPITPQKRYILAASFQAPGGQRLFDEYEFEFRIDRKEILNSLTETSKQGE